MNILLVDDDPQGLETVQRILEASGYSVFSAANGQDALQMARTQNPDLVVSDVRMPKMGGLEFLKALRSLKSEVPVILMTAFGQVEEAVWAMKLGAVDFLSKPFKRQTLLSAVQSAAARISTAPKNKNAPSWGTDLGLTGRSPELAKIRQFIRQVAKSDSTVLILGESGTGKEKVAHLIHQLSSRASGQFVPVNCGAIPENLIESELFGHEKGAFTGAQSSRRGLFEEAHGGTLFLDEVGDLPLSTQVKLLRAIQEGEIRRLGATRSEKVDVRLISATHHDLKKLVETQLFRGDLFYRLDVVRISVPSLRERREDIPLLISEILDSAKTRLSKSLEGLSPQALETLIQYDWPGNIRELQNALERALVLTQGPRIDLNDLPEHLIRGATSLDPKASQISIPLGTPLREVEELMIQRTLELTGGDKGLTAKLLGINSRTIYRKLESKAQKRIESPHKSD